MDTFNDKNLNCADCGQEFVFSKNEQAFYAERGFTNEPKRCKNCRDKRKNAREGNGGGRGERAMVSVTCDSCGVATEVRTARRLHVFASKSARKRCRRVATDADHEHDPGAQRRAQGDDGA